MMTTVSLIITTYNHPEALALVLDSALRQSRQPEEIIIADDGSSDDTLWLIEGYQYQATIPIVHAYQKDEGFRLARSRNNAIRMAKGDYLIVVDGDTILHPDFVADHLRLSAPNVFCIGSRLLLSEQETQTVFANKKFHFSFKHTDAPDKIKALHFPWINYFFSLRKKPIEQLIYKIRGCNMAFWRQDVEAVNGFNQDIEGWGREDSEFAARLFKKGLALRTIKFAAIQYHLWRPENNRASLPENDQILANTLQSSSIQCKNGLMQME